MRRLGVVLALTLLALTGSARSRGWTNIDDDDCSTRSFRFDGQRGHVVEEVIDAPSLKNIRVTNAPVTVTGGNSRGYTIRVCKAARLASDLDRIQVSVSGGDLKATGPDNDDWAVMYRIDAPDGADLEIEARNGPVSLRDLDGTVTARLQNGPLSLRNTSGRFDVQTVNGPISLRGGSGNVKMTASNGPLSIHLDGSSWRGGALEASTKNGPLSVKVPRGYNSGVVVETSGHGPVSCKAEGCSGARLRSWDDEGDEPRKFELGSGPQVVHVSTVNGPVTIKDGDD
jgi:hypothetical protein